MLTLFQVTPIVRVMRTEICERLGIEFPIFAFSHCRDVVAAVSKAGGYGVFGVVAFTPDELDIELNWIDEHCGGKPYGIDLVIPAKYLGKGGGDEAIPDNLAALIPQEHRDFVERLLADHGVGPMPDDMNRMPRTAGLNVDAHSGDQLEVALAHGASMVVNALGPPPPAVIDKAHEHGALVGALVGSRQHAERQVAQGVDVIIAQGTEAGGHCGDISTMVLVPDVVDAVGDRATVLAAGGIATGRQMAASLALGAQGVWTGSMWLTVAEADTPEPALQNMLAASSADTVRARFITGKPARQLKSAWTEAWSRPDAPGPLPMPLQGILWGEASRRFFRAGNRSLANFPVGQIVGRLNEVRASSEVILDMVNECIDTEERLHSLFQG